MILVEGFLQLRPGGVARLRPAITQQIAIARLQDGCLSYAIGTDLLDPERLCILESWHDRAAQARHLASDHMGRFNLAMRTVSVVRGELEAWEDGVVRKILEIPAQRYRPERRESDLVIVAGCLTLRSRSAEAAKTALIDFCRAAAGWKGVKGITVSADILDADVVNIAAQVSDTQALGDISALLNASPLLATLRKSILSGSVIGYSPGNALTLFERRPTRIDAARARFVARLRRVTQGAELRRLQDRMRRIGWRWSRRRSFN